MIHRVQGHLGAQHHIVTDGDGAAIQKDAVVVAEKVLAHPYIAAIVAVKRCFNVSTLAGVGEKLLHELHFFLPSGFRDGIEKPGDAHGV